MPPPENKHPRHSRIDAIKQANPNPADQLTAMQTELREVNEGVIAVMRMAVDEHPELRRAFLAITDDQPLDADALRELMTYPVVEELLVGLEQGLKLSRHSSVTEAIIPELSREIRKLETEVFRSESALP